MVREFFHDPILKKFFILAVVVRLVMLVLFWGQPLNIVDEQHYHAIATHIVDQGEFLGPNGKPTAIRPPLYPFLLAFFYKFFGSEGQNAVRVLQSLLSLGAGVLLFALSRTVALEVKRARIAVGFFLFYPPLLFFNCLILTESVFLFLFLAGLTCLAIVLEPVQLYRDRNNCLDGKIQDPESPGVVALSEFARNKILSATPSPSITPSLVAMALAGMCLGLATLTRSITYPMTMPLALLLLLFLNPLRWRSWAGVTMFLVLFLGALSPWIVRNYKVFDAFIPVDTMGGLNLYMGNFEHTPLHRAWAAVDNTEDKAWYRGHEEELAGKSEAEKQKWAITQGLAFIREHPELTALRTVIKAANFWGMDRALIAGMKDNFFQSFRATPVKIVVSTIILASYAVLMLFGFGGLVGRLIFKRALFDFLVVFIFFYFTAMHALVFGHSRYHLPLVPFLCIYGSWFLFQIKKKESTRSRDVKIIFWIVVFVLTVLWGYEIFIGSKQELSRLLTR